MPSPWRLTACIPPQTSCAEYRRVKYRCITNHHNWLSAGAMTVLQADYEKRDLRESAKALPDDFQYAGVIAYAGSIFSTEGTPSYTLRPAPTLFFHGSGDNLVPYTKTRFFKLGVFGSKALAKRFNEQGYLTHFIQWKICGHDVAEYPMRRISTGN